MNEKQLARKALVESQKPLTLEGVKCNLGGWSNPVASLAPHFGGFWNVSWETVERVIAGDGNFTAQDVTFVSWRWLGLGEDVPPALEHYKRITR